jgi:preprotein translocase subunit SecD
MRTLYLLSIAFLCFLLSCNSETKTSAQKVTFGIHEVVTVSEIPNAIIDTLKSMNIQIESNQQQSVIGYLAKADSLALQLNLSEQEFKIVKTIYPVDNEQKYYAIVAIKPNSVIDNSDIKNTRVNGNNVEIYFNLEGAKIWADMTKQNIGKPVAFIINGQIYTMPLINAEIRNGIAVLNGLKNETIAKNISESLNSGISD